MAGERKSFIVPQFSEDEEVNANIRHLLQIPTDYSALCTYVPKLFIKKGKGARIEYIQLQFGHTESFISIKKNIKGWLQIHSCDIYYNILQIEKSIKAGFFSNSHATMDLEVLKEEIEEKMNFKVGL